MCMMLQLFMDTTSSLAFELLLQAVDNFFLVIWLLIFFDLDLCFLFFFMITWLVVDGSGRYRVLTE